MVNVYEGQPDARQSDDVNLKPLRFRPTYRALTDDEKKLYDDIKAAAAYLEKQFDKMKDGRYKSLAMTNLEVSVMWVIKGLTS